MATRTAKTAKAKPTRAAEAARAVQVENRDPEAENRDPEAENRDPEAENRDPEAENRDPVPQSTRPGRVMVERRRPRCPRCGSLALVMDGGTYKMANGRTIHYATCRDCRARAAVVDV